MSTLSPVHHSAHVATLWRWVESFCPTDKAWTSAYGLLAEKESKFCPPPAQSTAVDLDGSAVADSGGGSLPYTFDRHAARPDPDAIQFVQIQVGKHSTCAFIQSQLTLANGVDLWQLEGIYPYMGRFYRAPAYVRQCSGLDGRCTCANEAEQGRAADASEARRGAGVRSAPDGNHGENN